MADNHVKWNHKLLPQVRIQQAKIILLTIRLMNCLQFYQQFVTSPHLLAQGHTLIAKYLLESADNRSNTLVHILTPSPPILPLVGNVYPSAVFPLIDEDEKAKTRFYLVQLLFKLVGQSGVMAKDTQSLMALIRRIHNEEGYDKWLNLYAQIIKNLPSQHIAPFMIALLQGADNRISTLSVNIFSFIIQSWQSGALTQTSTEELFQILYYCVRTFSHLSGTDETTLQAHYTPSESWLLKLVWDNLVKSPICMKYGFKILTVLYGDMNRFQEEDNSNVDKLFGYGMQLLQQFLKLVTDTRFCNAIEEEQEQQNTSNQLSTHLPVILFQLLQLYEIVVQKLQEEEEDDESGKINKTPVLLFSLLLTIPTRYDLDLWYQHTDQYMMTIEDEYQRTLRNRANALIVALLDESQDKESYIQTVKEYFGVIAGNISANNVVAAEQFINSKNKTGVPLSIPVEPWILQESSYFLLSSTISSLYSPEYRQQLVKYLMGRATQSPDILIQIITIYVCVNEMKQPYSQELVNFILQTIINNKTIYLRKQDIGLGIVLARGLGKVACGAEVIVGQTVPVDFIRLLASYLMSNKNGKPDEDGTYIVLELFLKLTECHPKNKEVLSALITAELQVFMINNYMHDGLLSSIVLKLLEHYPHQLTVNTIANTLLTGHIREQKYSQLIAKWVKSSILALTSSHIQQLLQLYVPPNHTLITPILKLYISLIGSNPAQLTPAIRQLLNKNPDGVLLVPMLRCNILQNVDHRLLQTLKNITYEETSQYEIEKKMMLVFHCGIFETSNFFTLLKQSNGQLYENFIQKILKYSRLFNGQNLRIVTSIFLLKLSEIDPSLTKQASSLVASYGNLETNEWQEEEEQGEEDMIERLINCKLENDELEKELEEVFDGLIGSGQGSEYIKAKMGQLQ